MRHPVYAQCRTITYLFIHFISLSLLVSARVETRTVLLLRDGHVHAVEPMLQCHQEARLSKPRRQQKLHAEILQGSVHTALLVRQRAHKNAQQTNRLATNRLANRLEWQLILILIN